MSTRRARIKAVAALPPRRKNVETAEGNKNKQIANAKEVVEKSPRTPKTPRTSATFNHENSQKNSPAAKILRTPPSLNPISVTKTPISSENILSIESNTDALLIGSPRASDVPEVASTSNSKTANSTFLSPLNCDTGSNNGAAPSPELTSQTQSSLTPSLEKQRTNSEDVVQKTSVITGITPLSTNKRNDIPDDYSIPSIPESITEDTVMDGIVQLKPAQSAPKPIDLLKNEIISEYAEVLFDPIVPLPSPNKVRPKLRPVPRLAPHRRNSIQGSASESEDESRRALLASGAPVLPPSRQRHDSHTSHSTLPSVPNSTREVNRIRNDSVCSSVSQMAAQPAPATSPAKEKQFSKGRRPDMNRRTWRRRRETVKRDGLTMYDLIFYNPTTNPIVPDQDEVQAKLENAKDEAERIAKGQSEEEVDDPPAADAAPVPQIKLGPNGEIVLDETSLVIKQSDAYRKVSSVVREGSWGAGSGGRYTRAARTADWSAAETVRFYRALAAIGTDFSLMARLFPDRTRKDLKLKFKKEERQNGAQVDKALRSAIRWDVAAMQAEFQAERAEAELRAERDLQRARHERRAERERLRAARHLRVRPSRGAKAVNMTAERDAQNSELTANDFIKRALEDKANSRRKPSKASRPPPDLIPRSPNSFATLTLVDKDSETQPNEANDTDMATISRVDPKVPNLNNMSGIPSNIETGSLVVLRVNDPASPTKTMLQTYIAHGAGKLTPVSLPSTFLNSVVGYMKKGTPKSTVSSGSSPVMSPGSAVSQDSRAGTPSVIQLNPNPSPTKRQRHSSYTITQL